MNIANLTALIPASFDYVYIDAAEAEQTEKIELQLKRVSFGVSTSKAFKAAIENEDSEAMAEILSGLIESWNMDMNGEPFPPTAENLNLLPVEFVAQAAACAFERLFPNTTRALNSPNGSGPKENQASAASNSESDSPSPKRAATGG